MEFIVVVYLSTLTLHPIAWRVFVCKGKIPRLNSAILGLTFEFPALTYYTAKILNPTLNTITGLLTCIVLIAVFSSVKRYDNYSLAILWTLLFLQTIGIALIF